MKRAVNINLGPKVSGTMLLTLAFFAAKIFGYITWSWWWVFAPLWVSTVLGLAFVACALSFLFVVYVLSVLAGR